MAPFKWGLADDLGQFGLQQVPISSSVTPASGVFGCLFWTLEVIFMLLDADQEIVGVISNGRWYMDASILDAL